MEGGSEFKLIMALDDWQYQAKHIPGSLPFSAVTGSQMSKLLHAGIADAVPKILTQLKHVVRAYALYLATPHEQGVNYYDNA